MAYIESQSTNWHYKMSQSKKEGLQAVTASCVVWRSLVMDLTKQVIITEHKEQNEIQHK